MNTWTEIGLGVAAGVAIIFAALIGLAARRGGRRSAVAAGGGLGAGGLGASGLGAGGLGASGLGAGGGSAGGGSAGGGSAGGGEREVLSRRDLINRGVVGAFSAALAGVVASFVAFVWPTVTGTTGTRYAVGGLEDIRRRLAVDRRPYVGGHGHFYLVPFPAEHVAAARAVYPTAVVVGMEAGVVALSPVCTHQGCQVPYCASSAWFECPCHGSRYDGVGEQRRGPAPRGLDHYAVTIENGTVVVDTRRLYPGPPPGTRTVDDPADGPHCY